MSNDTATARLPTRWRRWARRKALACGACIGLCVLAFLIADAIWPLPIAAIRHFPASPVVTDRHGNTLYIATGSEQQWRLPVASDALSPHLKHATLALEDERFYFHYGVDPIAIGRAAWQNLTHGKVVSGASTLPMQIARMLNPQPRTWSAKTAEAFRAIQLENHFTKDELLALYLNIAPYGGNVRGAEAAARTYFNKSAVNLTVAEAALLAAIPQSPERLRPDRHADRTRIRRNYAIIRMRNEGYLTEDEATAASQSSIKLRPWDRTRIPDFVTTAALARRPSGGKTTIDLAIQNIVERAVAEHLSNLPEDSDIAVVVIDVRDASIVAWVGNANQHDRQTGNIDGVLAFRSPGSTLKPFIYATAFERQRLHPSIIVTDRQTTFAEWRPRNYSHDYLGEVTVAAALRRSLNIPALAIAQHLGLDACAHTLSQCGIRYTRATVQRAGLSLVTGGAEARLLDLVSAYAVFARSGTYVPPRLFVDEPTMVGTAVFSSQTCAAINHTLSNIERERPEARRATLATHGWYMWKTGTSSARRDAWAIGHNGRYALGVWVGRFSGAAHSSFVGKIAAEPLLRNLFETPAIKQRCTSKSPTCPDWLVTNPIQFEADEQAPLRILSPPRDSRFVAINGRTAVHAQVNRATPVTWFINDVFAGTDTEPRFELPIGRHRLRAVTADGESDGVVVVIRPPS